MSFLGCEHVSNRLHFDEGESLKLANRMHQVFNFILLSNKPLFYSCLWLSASHPAPSFLLCFFLYPQSSFHSFSQSIQVFIYLRGLGWLIPRNNSRKQDRPRQWAILSMSQMFSTGQKLRYPLN